MVDVAHIGAQNNMFFPLKIKSDSCINLLLYLRHLMSLRPWTNSEFFPLGYASLFKVTLKTSMINTFSSPNSTDGCATCSEEGTLGHVPLVVRLLGRWCCLWSACLRCQVPDSLCCSSCVIYFGEAPISWTQHYLLPYKVTVIICCLTSIKLNY